jgi:hypothetical protein
MFFPYLGADGRYRTNVWDYAGVNAFRGGRDADCIMRSPRDPKGNGNQ